MTAGSEASRRVLARTPVAPLPASSPTRPTGITGRMSAPAETSSPEVCSFRLPQMCGFRLPLTTPGATSTASGLVSRCPPPGGLYDGDDEASRVPGKPTRTHATRSDPGEVAASTASETRRDDLPSNARRRPSHSMHFGAQSRGLRAPCERFAPWVTPGPRITRFRLAADLGRMGLDTHRVSNKVSKITSRHLVPLDRAFPAHALLHSATRQGWSKGSDDAVTS